MTELEERELEFDAQRDLLLEERMEAAVNILEDSDFERLLIDVMETSRDSFCEEEMVELIVKQVKDMIC